MQTDASESSDLLIRAAAGDRAAVDELFVRYRDRLERMVRLRMNQRLLGRIDAADILQEAFLEVSKGLTEYLQAPKMPFFLWLRYITCQQLIVAHRRHLGAQMRDAGQEVSLYHGSLPQASSISLAQHLLGRLTSASHAAVRAELQVTVQEALNSMDPIDREVLALRHFELLSNGETAEVLGLTKTAASNRYVRALGRMKEILSALPDFRE